MKSKKTLRNRNQNHNELYTTPSTIGGCCIFYTDHHDVDEDIVTIPAQGGRKDTMTIVGITHRDVSDISNTVRPTVAF